MSTKCIVSFILGAVVGTIGSGYFVYKKLKDEYENEANTTSKNSYSAGFKAGYKKALEEQGSYTELVQEDTTDEAEEDYSNMELYSEVTSQKDYTDYTKMSSQKDITNVGPEVIAPDQYGEDDSYDQISLTYYADGVVADDNDEAMSDQEVDESIGLESLDTFGQFEDDAVHVVNDERKAYYEILRDERCYEDVIAEKPYLNEFDES